MRWLPVLVLSVACGAGCGRTPPPEQLVRVQGGDAQAGRVLIREVGCGACHEIPGVGGARGRVGPSLAGFATRTLIGGRVPNRPAELSLWVRDAPAFDPQTGMPPMPLDAAQAGHVAAYLYTLHER